MRVQGLDGKPHAWTPVSSPRENASGLHRLAKKLLCEMFPTCQVAEEVRIPGCSLFADFYLPGKRLMVEVQGRQHREHVVHFHGTKRAFLDAKRRDRDKREFCTLNKITLVELPEGEDESDWIRRLRKAC